MATYKIVTVGATQVGKTATLYRFHNKKVPEKLGTTIGEDIMGDFFGTPFDFEGETVMVRSLSP